MGDDRKTREGNGFLADALTVNDINKLLLVLQENGLSKENIQDVIEERIPINIGRETMIAESWPVQFLKDNGILVCSIEETEAVFGIHFSEAEIVKLKKAREKIAWRVAEAIDKDMISFEELLSLDPHIVIEPPGLSVHDIFQRAAYKFDHYNAATWRAIDVLRSEKSRSGVSFRLMRDNTESFCNFIQDIVTENEISLAHTPAHCAIIGWLVDRKETLLSKIRKKKFQIASEYIFDGTETLYAGVSKKGIMFNTYKTGISDPLFREYTTLKIFL